MEINAPGRLKLKVTGILYIIGAGCSILVGLLAMLGGGLALSAEDGSGYGLALGAIAGGAGVVVIISSLLGLVTGILGVKNSNKPEKCGVNFVLGIIMLVLVVIGIIGDFIKGADSAGIIIIAGVIEMIIPVIYTWGAKQNKDAV